MGVSTTNHQLSSQVVILLVSKELCAWFPTPLPLPRPFPVLITSSILCTPREPSSTGMSVRVWKKVNSPKPVRILLPLRRITKRSVPKPLKGKVRRKTSEKNIKFINWTDSCRNVFHLLVDVFVVSPTLMHIPVMLCSV